MMQFKVVRVLFLSSLLGLSSQAFGECKTPSGGKIPSGEAFAGDKMADPVLNPWTGQYAEVRTFVKPSADCTQVYVWQTVVGNSVQEAPSPEVCDQLNGAHRSHPRFVSCARYNIAKGKEHGALPSAYVASDGSLITKRDDKIYHAFQNGKFEVADKGLKYAYTLDFRRVFNDASVERAPAVNESTDKPWWLPGGVWRLLNGAFSYIWICGSGEPADPAL